MVISSILPCRNISDFLGADTRTEVTEYFSPDILHVFRDEVSDFPTILSKDPTTLVPPPRASSFPQFQRLPPELRCLIWEAAVPEPTVVPRTWNNGNFRYNLQRKVPAVLQACSESRRLLLAQPEARPISATRKYELVQRRGRKEEGVFMNWKTDSIWIYRGYDINDAEVAAYASLQSLVMNWGLRPCWVDPVVDEGVRFIRQFPKLKLLTLLVDFSEHGWPEPSTLGGLKRLKRSEVKRIWALVQKAFSKAQALDSSWTPPSLHIVHRTENWSRQEAK